MQNQLIDLNQIQIDSIIYSEIKEAELKVMTIFCPESSYDAIIKQAVKHWLPFERFNNGIDTGIIIYNDLNPSNANN